MIGMSADVWIYWTFNMRRVDRATDIIHAYMEGD